MSTPITIVGNLTGDPELRFTPSGAAVANFSVASNERKFDRDKNEWVDGDSTFWRVNAWRGLAENVAESFARGDRVIVVGKAKQRSFETKEGEKRTVIEVEAEEVAGSVKYATAKMTKASRGNGGGNSGGNSGNGGGQPASDPWTNGGDEPPF